MYISGAMNPTEFLSIYPMFNTIFDIQYYIVFVKKENTIVQLDLLIRNVHLHGSTVSFSFFIFQHKLLLLHKHDALFISINLDFLVHNHENYIRYATGVNQFKYEYINQITNQF